eukprot:780507-Rhodomonas_salina.2
MLLPAHVLTHLDVRWNGIRDHGAAQVLPPFMAAMLLFMVVAPLVMAIMHSFMAIIPPFTAAMLLFMAVAPLFMVVVLLCTAIVLLFTAVMLPYMEVTPPSMAFIHVAVSRGHASVYGGHTAKYGDAAAISGSNASIHSAAAALCSGDTALNGSIGCRSLLQCCYYGGSDTAMLPFQGTTGPRMAAMLTRKAAVLFAAGRGAANVLVACGARVILQRHR